MSLQYNDATRLNYAIDMLLKHLLASESEGVKAEELNSASAPCNSAHCSGLDDLLEGGVSNASRSARRKRRPPPDLSS